MQSKFFLSSVLALGLALASPAGLPAAGEGASAQKPAAEQVPAQRTPPDARAYFTDLELVNQHGRKMRFYSDALEGKTVLINVIFTNCKEACPLITQKLKEVRNQVGAMFGKEVHFVSISSDPVRDTPQALKAFAVKQHADEPGWTFLTGNKENVDHILKKLGQFSENVEEHSTLLIAGNVPKKRWSKIRPDAPSEAIAERLRVLAGGGVVPLPGAAN